MNEKLKISTLKKSLLFMIFIVVSIFYGCDLNEPDKVFRRQITIETNLSFLKIGSLNLDSTTVYPYILNDVYSPNLGGYGTIIYPVLDSGVIKLNIYGGEGYNSQLSFKDSMTIYTPVDTVYIETNAYNFLRY
jgi:hypothetical protein